MVLDFGDFLLKQSVYAPGFRQPRHTHDYNNVTVVVAGQIEETTDDGHYAGKPGSVVLKAAGREHENRVSGFGAKTLSIQFSNGLGLRPNAWLWLERPPVVRAALDLCGAFDGGRAVEVERAAASLLEVAIAGDRKSSSPPQWLASVRAHLDEHFHRTVRFESLARDLGLHPVYLSRAFQRHEGISMTEYVQALRVRSARHALWSSRRSVAAIAAEAGFADSSHLCRTFSRLLGMTPRQYRKRTTSQV